MHSIKTHGSIKPDLSGDRACSIEAGASRLGPTAKRKVLCCPIIQLAIEPPAVYITLESCGEGWARRDDRNVGRPRGGFGSDCKARNSC